MTAPTGEPSILTLIERQTHFALTIKLPKKKNNYVNQVVLNHIEHYPIKLITTDNGSEFTLLNEIDSIDVYFAYTYSSHE